MIGWIVTIKNNKNRVGTKTELLPLKSDNLESIDVNNFEAPEDEILFTCNKIKEINKYQDTCVIARNKYLLENVKEKLEEFSIPYYIPMGNEKFSTRELNLLIELMPFLLMSLILDSVSKSSDFCISWLKIWIPKKNSISNQN